MNIEERCRWRRPSEELPEEDTLLLVLRDSEIELAYHDSGQFVYRTRKYSSETARYENVIMEPVSFWCYLPPFKREED